MTTSKNISFPLQTEILCFQNSYVEALNPKGRVFGYMVCEEGDKGYMRS
jgi:hypothetical protein